MVCNRANGIKSSEDWAEKGDIIDQFYNDHYEVYYSPSGKEVVKTFADTIQMLLKKGIAFEPACLR